MTRSHRRKPVGSSDCQKSGVIPRPVPDSYALRAGFVGHATHSLRAYGRGDPLVREKWCQKPPYKVVRLSEGELPEGQERPPWGASGYALLAMTWSFDTLTVVCCIIQIFMHPYVGRGHAHAGALVKQGHTEKIRGYFR